MFENLLTFATAAFSVEWNCVTEMFSSLGDRVQMTDIDLPVERVRERLAESVVTCLYSTSVFNRYIGKNRTQHKYICMSQGHDYLQAYLPILFLYTSHHHHHPRRRRHHIFTIGMDVRVLSCLQRSTRWLANPITKRCSETRLALVRRSTEKRVRGKIVIG